MGNNLSVYRQLVSSPANMFEILKKEIGLTTNCIPFAVKAQEALKSLGTLTESEAVNAANIFFSGLQTLSQGGITAEDYDKIDFIKRGKAITISARVEAFYRAAAKKGYIITDKIIAVPKEDKDTTYFKEALADGNMVYILEDKRVNPDRKITAERIAKGYFAKYICRLIVNDMNHDVRLMFDCEIYNDEMLQIANTSEQGIYKSEWVEYQRKNGTVGRRKVLSEELNTDGFWYKWTGEMVNKTIIRRALKRVKEVLPELKESIYAFDKDEEYTEVAENTPPKIDFEIPLDTVNVDLNNLTAEQKADCNEMLTLFKANPKLATDKANEIKGLLQSGADKQEIINTHYASIVCILKGKTTSKIIKSWFGGEDDA